MPAPSGLLKFFLFFIFPLLSFSQDPLKYVNPFIGTGGHGHTFPGATVPFGMVQLSPDTRMDNSWDGCGGYHYDDSLIYGFSHTHLSGTGVSDYADILLFPFTDKYDKSKKYSSHFTHDKETASPGYYQVKLNNDSVNVELSASKRCGFHRYTFKSDTVSLLLDLIHRDKVIDAEFEKIDETHFRGYRRSESWAGDQLLYFYIEFSSPVFEQEFEVDSFTREGEILIVMRGKIKAALQFVLPQSKKLEVKIGLSSVSSDGAKRNLEKEIKNKSFEEIKKEAEELWRKELSKIIVSGGVEKDKRIFYTALYHCMIAPNIFNDVDGRYRGRDGKIHKSITDHYTVFSLWDTFRAWHPLMTIIDRKRTADYIRTFLKQYEQGGLLPVWELSSNETECMIGYHSVSVIADAYIKGIKDFDTEYAFKAMIKSASSKNRFGLGQYMENHFLDITDESESVSKTLEYSYDDWCISRYAAHTGHAEEAKLFGQRSNYWKNLFNTENGFIQPRKNGAWLNPFDPNEVNNNYTEANAWQYTFFVPHDIQGLICKLNGLENFEHRLDSLFHTSSLTSGREQADITGLIGQYAHGNEPSHHMAYLYNFTNSPWKTDQYITRIRREMYNDTPDGLIGNEDCGQMSAWYVLSALGMYPVCPGLPQYELTTPLFEKAVLNFENGLTFTINSEKKESGPNYIEEITLNGKSRGRHIFHSDLMEGGELIVRSGDKELNEGKSTNGGNERLAAPCTFSGLQYFPVPGAHISSEIFTDSSFVKLDTEKNSTIYYTLDGSYPDQHSKKYIGPFYLKESTTVKAIAFRSVENKSAVLNVQVNKILHPEWKVQLFHKYNPQYSGGGDAALVDGLYGDADWRKGRWQGFQDSPFEVIIDLGETKTIDSVSANFLQDTKSWILMPRFVEFLISSDGKLFTPILHVDNTLPDTVMKKTIQKMGGKVKTEGRYLKLYALNYGDLPGWHLGVGEPAFIFIDEVEIR
jgi:predicted alpha-1,2-mannosidase